MNMPVLYDAHVNFDHHVSEALYWANQARCRSRMEGVVLVDSDQWIPIAHGFSHPPHPCDCESLCSGPCGEEAVCAIADCLEHVRVTGRARSAEGATLIHTAVSGGKLTPVRAPSCTNCGSLTISAKIEGVWLLHINGWVYYTSLQYNAFAWRAQAMSTDVIYLSRPS